MQALILRGAALGLIGDARKKSLYVQLSTKGWCKNEPVTVGRESPFLLWTLLSRTTVNAPTGLPLTLPPTVVRSIAATPTSPSLRPDSDVGQRCPRCTSRPLRALLGHRTGDERRGQ
jgi:hypothetical protein